MRIIIALINLMYSVMANVIKMLWSLQMSLLCLEQ